MPLRQLVVKRSSGSSNGSDVQNTDCTPAQGGSSVQRRPPSAKLPGSSRVRNRVSRTRPTIWRRDCRDVRDRQLGIDHGDQVLKTSAASRLPSMMVLDAGDRITPDAARVHTRRPADRFPPALASRASAPSSNLDLNRLSTRSTDFNVDGFGPADASRRPDRTGPRSIPGLSMRQTEELCRLRELFACRRRERRADLEIEMHFDQAELPADGSQPVFGLTARVLGLRCASGHVQYPSRGVVSLATTTAAAEPVPASHYRLIAAAFRRPAVTGIFRGRATVTRQANAPSAAEVRFAASGA